MNVSNTLINNNFPFNQTDIFIEADGKETKNIFMKNNVLNNVTTKIKKGASLGKKAITE